MIDTSTVSGSAEMVNSQPSVMELCDLLGLLPHVGRLLQKVKMLDDWHGLHEERVNIFAEFQDRAKRAHGIACCTMTSLAQREIELREILIDAARTKAEKLDLLQERIDFFPCSKIGRKQNSLSREFLTTPWRK